MKQNLLKNISIGLLTLSGAILLGFGVTNTGTLTTDQLAGASVLLGTQGGTGVSSYIKGDVLYAGSTFTVAAPGTATLSKLGVGSTGQCLGVSAGIPAWGACGTGITGIGVQENGSAFTTVTSLSFSSSAFNVSFSSPVANVALDYTNGPASRTINQNITGTYNFTGGASFSPGLEVGSNNIASYASLSNNLFLNQTRASLSSNFEILGNGVASASIFNSANGGTVAAPAFRLSGGVGVYLVGATTLGLTNGTSGLSWDGTSFFPNTDAVRNLGKLTTRWSQLFTQNASLSGSGRLEDTSSEVSGAVASISAINLTSGSVFKIIVPNSGFTGNIFQTVDTNGRTIASISGVGNAEFAGYASASAYKGIAFPSAGCTGSLFLQWTNTGLFSCGTPVSSGITGMEIRTVPVGTKLVNRPSISFDNSAFNVVASGTTDAQVSLDYVNGPASRSIAQTISGAYTFTNGATISSNFEVAGYASLSNNAFFSSISGNYRASVSGAFEIGTNASAQFYRGSAFNFAGNCSGTSFIQWSTTGLFTCAAAPGSSTGITGMEITSTPAGTKLRNIPSISFDNSAFNVTASGTTDARISIDYLNGPASRSIAQSITALWTFTGGASISQGLDVSSNVNANAVASISGNSLTTGIDLKLLSTGIIVTPGSMFAIQANALTTGSLASFSAQGAVTGNLIQIRSGLTSGAVASISVPSFTSGNIFSIMVPTTATGNLLTALNNNSKLVASVSALGAMELNSYASVSALGIFAGGRLTADLEIGDTALATAVVSVSAQGVTTGNAFKFTANALTTGQGMLITNKTAQTGVGCLLCVVDDATTSGVVASISGKGTTTGAVLQLTSAGLNATGSTLKIIDAVAGAGSALSIKANANASGTVASISSTAMSTGALLQLNTNGPTTGTQLRIVDTANFTGAQTGSEMEIVANADTRSSLASFSATAAFVTPGSIIQIRTGLTTGAVASISIPSATTGQVFNIIAPTGGFPQGQVLLVSDQSNFRQITSLSGTGNFETIGYVSISGKFGVNAGRTQTATLELSDPVTTTGAVASWSAMGAIVTPGSVQQIRTAVTTGAVASISAVSLTGGDVFRITIPAASFTGTVFNILNTNSTMIASLSGVGNFEAVGYASFGGNTIYLATRLVQSNLASTSIDFSDGTNTRVLNAEKCIPFFKSNPTSGNISYVGPRLFVDPFTITRVVVVASASSNAVGWNLKYGAPGSVYTGTSVFTNNKSASVSTATTYGTGFTYPINNSTILDGNALELIITSRSATVQSLVVQACGRDNH